MILAIYCCGGHGRELLILANRINSVEHRWNEIIFIDDNIETIFSVKNKVLTFEKIKALYKRTECEFVIASGEPYLLEALSNKVLDNGYNLTYLISNDVIVESDMYFMPGCVIQEKAIISCNVSIGVSTCIGFSSILHHDVKIGDYCFVAANSTICGNVKIGDRTFIGAGSVIRDEINIGSNCIIGMGSVIVKDIPENSIVYGNPARIVSKNLRSKVFK